MAGENSQMWDTGVAGHCDLQGSVTWFREGVLFSYPIAFAPSSRNGWRTSPLGFSVDWATLENEAPGEDGHPLLRVVGSPRV